MFAKWLKIVSIGVLVVLVVVAFTPAAGDACDPGGKCSTFTTASGTFHVSGDTSGQTGSSHLPQVRVTFVPNATSKAAASGPGVNTATAAVGAVAYWSEGSQGNVYLDDDASAQIKLNGKPATASAGGLESWTQVIYVPTTAGAHGINGGAIVVAGAFASNLHWDKTGRWPWQGYWDLTTCDSEAFWKWFGRLWLVLIKDPIMMPALKLDVHVPDSIYQVFGWQALRSDPWSVEGQQLGQGYATMLSNGPGFSDHSQRGLKVYWTWNPQNGVWKPIGIALVAGNGQLMQQDVWPESENTSNHGQWFWLGEKQALEAIALVESMPGEFTEDKAVAAVIAVAQKYGW